MRPALNEGALAELASFLSIPSVSADPTRRGAVREAADWVVALIRGAGGAAEVVDWGSSPIVDGTIFASRDSQEAPTILCYGHVDVQPPGPLDCWDSDPFVASIHDGWMHARGIADDKGQLWLLLRAAADLAAADALPVNVRFCCDGEEEIGGTAIVDYLRLFAGSPAACVIFDTPMLDDVTHVFTTGTRGTLYMHVEVRAGRRDLHSGIYGGAALNAAHVLVRALCNLFDENGMLVSELQLGAQPAPAAEQAAWRSLPDGRTLLAAQGAAAADVSAERDFYLRTWAAPSLDVNGIEGGSPVQQKTIVVAEARANLSMRLATGQRIADQIPVVERLLRCNLPQGAELVLDVLSSCEPGNVPGDSLPLKLAASAFERALERKPLMLRSGGSLPIMPLLEELGLPGVITGFAVPDSNMHAPNERMRLTDLGDGLAAAHQMFLAFAALPTSAATGPAV